MKKHLALILAIAFCGLLSAAEKRIYQCSFQPEDLTGWEIPAAVAQVESADGAPALRVTVSPSEKNPRFLATHQIDFAPYRGKRLHLICEVKGENISIPPQSWNGAKAQFHFKTQERDVWGGASIPRGSFGWTTVYGSTAVPQDATTGIIELGMEASSGSVWFRNVRITVEQSLFNLPQGFKAVYTDRVRQMPRLRGVQSPDSFKPEDIEELKRWNVNLIRWSIWGDWGRRNSEFDLEEYLRWFEQQLGGIDQMLDKCGKLGIKVALDLHTPPGGRDETQNMVMFYQKEYRDAFYAVWEMMAKRYKGNPAVWGYDLINEPAQLRPTEDGCLSVQYEAAKRIRAIDPETPIIIEPMGSLSEAFAAFEPLPLPDIIYQVHMYWPSFYTHQKIVIHPPKPIAYPGMIAGVFCDREQLKRYLEPVRQFEKKYGAKIFLGEFAVVRFAPGAEQYLADLISILEEYEWDWCYYAFRVSKPAYSASFWSVELDADGKPAETTPRKELLLKYFSKNR